MGVKLKIAYLAIFVLFLLSASASALTESLAVSASSPVITACSCGLFTNNIIVRNTGDVPSTYVITQEGTAASFSTLVSNAFSLGPQGSNDITDYLKIPCSAQGTYTLITNAETQFGTKQALQQSLNVGQCENVRVIVKKIDQASLCACTPVSYVVEVTNTASFEDTFAFKTNKDGIRLSQDQLTLQPGESQDLYIYANLPCDVYGDQDFKLSVQAKNSGFSDSTIVPLKIKSCYNYAVSAPKELSLCNAETAGFDATVYNLDEIANTYTLDVDKYATFTNGSKIFLWQYTNGTVPLTVGELRPGKYNITISADPQRGDASKQGVVSLNVDRCNSADVSISKRQDNLVSCESAQYDVAVKNDGSKANSYGLVMTSPAWASMNSSGQISLAPNAEQIIPLNVNVPCDFNGKAQIRINATVSGKTSADTSVLDLKVYSKEDAYRLNVDVKPTTIYYKNEDIPVTLENSGIRQTTYDLAVKGPDWVGLDTTSITLAPGNTATVYLKTSPSRSVAEDTYRVEVSARVRGDSLVFAKIFDLPLRINPWYVKVFNYLKSYKWYILIGTAALLALLILIYLIRRFARYIKRKRAERAAMPIPPSTPTIFTLEQPKKRRWPFVILIILLILALAAGGLLSYFYFTQYNQPTTSPLVSIDRQGLPGFGNTIIIRGFDKVRIPLILSNPFSDDLSYDIKIDNTPWIEVDRNFVDIVPKGTERVNLDAYPDRSIPDGLYKLQISARLPKENKIYTETLNIVLQRFAPWYERYLQYMIGGAAALAALLAIISFFRRSKGKAHGARSEDDLLKELDRVQQKEYKALALHDHKKRSWKWLWILIGVLVILALLSGAIYYVGQGVTIPPAKPTDGSSSKSIISVNGTGIKGVEVQGSLVIIRGTQNVTIPLIIQNSDEGRAIYDISFANVPWLKVDQGHVELDEKASATVNLFIEPAKATGKRLEVKIATRLLDQNLAYNEAITLDIRAQGVRSLIETLRTYLVYIISSVAVLFIIVLVSAFSRRKRKTEVKELLTEFAKDSKMKDINLRDIKGAHTPRNKTHTSIGIRKR